MFYWLADTCASLTALAHQFVQALPVVLDGAGGMVLGRDHSSGIRWSCADTPPHNVSQPPAYSHELINPSRSRMASSWDLIKWH